MPVAVLKETSYGAYQKLGRNLLQSAESFISQANFDVLEEGSAKLVLSKASRYPGDDAAGVFGINFYRKCPSPNEAYEYWMKLPAALNISQYSGSLAFAAKDTYDYQEKRRAYENFYSCVFEDSTRSAVFVAPHCGDIRYIPDNVKLRPRDGIDKWSAGIACLCYEHSKVHHSDRRIICFIHTSSDHFKSFPAIIDVGDMGFQNKDLYQAIIGRLNIKYSDLFLEHLDPYAKSLQKNTVRNVRNAVLKNKISRDGGDEFTSDSFALKHNLGSMAKYGMNASNLDWKRIVKGVLDGTMPMPGVRLNHLFSGAKVARLLDLTKRRDAQQFDYCIQFECSEHYLKTDASLIAQVINEFILALP